MKLAGHNSHTPLRIANLYLTKAAFNLPRYKLQLACLNIPADCLAYPLLHDSDRHDWSLWLQAHGAGSARARRGLSFTDQHLLVRAAAQGLALVRRLYAQADLAQGTLVQPLDVQWPTQFAYYLVGLPGSFETVAGRGFVEWVQDEAQGWDGEHPPS